MENAATLTLLLPLLIGSLLGGMVPVFGDLKRASDEKMDRVEDQDQSQNQRQRTGVSALHEHKSGKGQSDFSDWPLFNAGNYLLSHTLSRAVPSAQRGLTSVFGMGTGGTPAVRSPTTCSSGYWDVRVFSRSSLVVYHSTTAKDLAANL